MKSLPKQNVEIWGGMECTINRVGENYFDQLDHAGHRQREADIELFAGLGLKKMRYPVLWEHHQPVSQQGIDWTTTARKLDALRKHGIDVIAGLVHHGSGPQYVDIADDSFAEGLADYAAQVAAKFPWINYYTPVNEPLTTARFCGLYGLWHPHEQNDVCFCRILVNECKATVMAMAAIRVFNPEAKLVQTDDLGKIHSTPALAYQADFENERRWLSYDLLCGRVNADHPLWDYLLSHGIEAAELTYFTAHPCPPDILGINYYLTSERYIDEGKEAYPRHTHGGNGRQTYADVEAVRVGIVRPDGLCRLLKEAWDRYGIPIAVTEVHLHCTREEQMRWLKQVWDIANNLHNENIPILAITPWALLGSFGWDRLLTRRRGTYESGVFDLSTGYPRPTILAAMIRAYSKQHKFIHPALETAGWWERDCRVIYGKAHLPPQARAGKLLAISGMYAGELAEICRTRGLNYTTTATEFNWATIKVNEYLEIKTTGKIELVIPLTSNELNYALNKGIDLFIDGESGYWVISADGTVHQQQPDYHLIKHFLAS